MSSETPTLAMTIDVEDWFHLVGAGLEYQFKSVSPGPESWVSYPGRVEGNVHWILDQLDAHGFKATFFVLGWIGDRYPTLVREIHRRGHEIASHSYWHKVLTVMSPDEFREDVRRSLGVLGGITGETIRGFRVSSASITSWALDILAEEALVYDSSFFPVSVHDVYGKLSGFDISQPIERLPNGLWEIKMSSLRMGKVMLPWSGGGYFRLMPYRLFRRGIKQIVAHQDFYQFFAHPWELDPAAPRLTDLKTPYYFRRYVGIRRTRRRYQSLLKDFRFITIREALDAWTRKFKAGNVDAHSLVNKPAGDPAHRMSAETL